MIKFILTSTNQSIRQLNFIYLLLSFIFYLLFILLKINSSLIQYILAQFPLPQLLPAPTSSPLPQI